MGMVYTGVETVYGCRDSFFVLTFSQKKSDGTAGVGSTGLGFRGLGSRAPLGDSGKQIAGAETKKNRGRLEAIYIRSYTYIRGVRPRKKIGGGSCRRGGAHPIPWLRGGRRVAHIQFSVFAAAHRNAIGSCTQGKVTLEAILGCTQLKSHFSQETLS
jgi:hypothetical protein